MNALTDIGSSDGFRLVIAGVLAPGAACLLALLLCWMNRHASAATRHLAWLLSFVSMAACVPFALIHFGIAVPILPPIASSALPPQVEPGPRVAIFIRSYAIVWPEPLPKPLSATSGGWTLLLVCWAAGFVALSLRSLIGILRLRRIIGDSRAAEDASLLALHSELCSLIGLRKLPRLFLSRKVAVPLVTDVWRPRVILPEIALQWPPSMLRAALIHEMAHIRRNDLSSSAFAWLVVSIYWFNPFAWYGFRALQAEAEMAADDCVVTQESQPVFYAESLVTLVRNLRRSAVSSFPAIGMLRSSGIEARVRRILDSACHRSTPRKTVWCAALCSAAVLTGGISALRPVAASPALIPNPSPAIASEAPNAFATEPFRLESEVHPAPLVVPLSSNSKANTFGLPMKMRPAARVRYDSTRVSSLFGGNYNRNLDSPGPGYREQKAATLNPMSPSARVKELLN